MIGSDQVRCPQRNFHVVYRRVTPGHLPRRLLVASSQATTELTRISLPRPRALRTLEERDFDRPSATRRTHAYQRVSLSSSHLPTPSIPPPAKDQRRTIGKVGPFVLHMPASRASRFCAKGSSRATGSLPLAMMISSPAFGALDQLGQVGLCLMDGHGSHRLSSLPS